MGEGVLKTGTGGLQIAGSAFRMTPFGATTSIAENIIFETAKNIKEGKPATKYDFRGVAKDYFLSDALGIKENHPYASVALDVITNLLMGKAEDRIADIGKLADAGKLAEAFDYAKTADNASAFRTKFKDYINETLDYMKANPELGAANFGAKVGGEETELTAGQKTRGFVESVEQSKNISGRTKENISGTYIPKTNKKLMGEAEVLLQDNAKLDFKNVKNLDQKIAATIQEAINLDKAGNHEAAANLYNNLAESGTELGRGVQAFSLLDKMSPEAISLSVAGKINKFNATHKAKIPPLTGEQQSKISAMVEDILNTPEGRERNIKGNELNILINSFIPSSFADKATTVWKAGLLTSLRTHGRNIIGNAIQGTTEIVKDIPATWADMLMSSKTGQRTTTFTTKGVGEFGSKTTRQQMADIITKGYDPSKSIEKFDIKKVNWGNNKGEQALKKVTDVVFNVLDAEDKPFYNAAFARSLYNQAGAAAINAGRKGDASFIENLVKNPSEDMLKNATADANIAAFRDKGVLSKAASGVKRAIANDKTGEVGKVVAETMLPFTGVPSSIAGQMVAYSPIGLIRGATDTGKVLIKNMPELQRQAAQEVGRGTIGTALFTIGAYLMEKGLMTGQPKDAVEAEQWKLEGKQPNSVLINGKWRSIGSVGPQTLILLAGAKYNEEMNNPEGSIGSFAGNIGKDFLSQTFLAGVQQPLNAITDPARYGKSYVSGQAGSIVPNIIKDFANPLIPMQRNK